jgi:prevent-host-death family protein
MANKIWQIHEAKRRFSELVERALNEGAQVITRHGKNAVVVLSYDEYQRLRRAPGRLSEFLLASPIAGSELIIERDSAQPPDIGIGQ